MKTMVSIKFNSFEDLKESTEYKSNEWFRITEQNNIISMEMIDLGPCVCGQRLIKINTSKVK